MPQTIILYYRHKKNSRAQSATHHNVLFRGFGFLCSKRQRDCFPSWIIRDTRPIMVPLSRWQLIAQNNNIASMPSVIQHSDLITTTILSFAYLSYSTSLCLVCKSWYHEHKRQVRAVHVRCHPVNESERTQMAAFLSSLIHLDTCHVHCLCVDQAKVPIISDMMETILSVVVGFCNCPAAHHIGHHNSSSLFPVETRPITSSTPCSIILESNHPRDCLHFVQAISVSLTNHKDRVCRALQIHARCDWKSIPVLCLCGKPAFYLEKMPFHRQALLMCHSYWNRSQKAICPFRLGVLDGATAEVKLYVQIQMKQDWWLFQHPCIPLFWPCP